MSRDPSPTIPEPRLRTVTQETPFVLFQCDKMGPGRTFHDTVVLKGTFDLAPGKLSLAREQLDIVYADEPWDPAAAERSSLKRAGELLVGKLGTDVLVTGTARVPGPEPRKDWDAALRVRGRGEIKLAYCAQALGPRSFRHTREKGWALTDPEPTLEVPIRYELAYGGAYPAPPSRSGEGEPAAEPTWVVHSPNPSGTGFFDESAMDTALEYRAPQWQHRTQPVIGINREVPLAGFGPVARPWTSRLKYAGTYDDAWLSATRDDVAHGRPVDYPADFDPRFFQCAHPELITPDYLEGNEEIALFGLMPVAGPFSFQLPCVRPVAELVDGEESSNLEALGLDTVHIDLDAATVSLCWRLTLNQARDIRAARVFLLEVT